MATPSRTLTWRIPWMEEAGRLQSLGSQRVGHDPAALLSFTFPVPRTGRAGQPSQSIQHLAAGVD